MAGGEGKDRPRRKLDVDSTEDTQEAKSIDEAGGEGKDRPVGSGDKWWLSYCYWQSSWLPFSRL